MTAAACAAADCDDNTAVYTREQVGSSFKPYVLATAVSQGMNVKTSVLDTSPYACIAPDQSSEYSVPLTAAAYAADHQSGGCLLSDGYPVENDSGEQIGKNIGTSSGAPVFSDNVQDALAQSSNVGFTDLAHKVGTQNVANMAANFGVNVTANGSQLDTGTYLGQVGMALGIAPLTVNEQTQMLATIADNGMYHQAHIVKYWQQGASGSEQMPSLAEHAVLTPSQDAQVQYAMEMTTIDGTAAQTVTYGQQAPGTVIGKTGTTSSSHAGFFIGSTTQYTLVVGMFTKSQADSYPNNLGMLGGGGFGGYWPAKIWNTFAESEFSSAPSLFSTSPPGVEPGRQDHQPHDHLHRQRQKGEEHRQGLPDPDAHAVLLV
jgi:membrane peptidoglycan carboxypeptidase